MTKVVRDRGGVIINIGPWDYHVEQVPTGQYRQVEDRDGDAIFEAITEARATNPLPAGAYEDEAEIVTGWDGGLYEANDPRRLPPDER